MLASDTRFSSRGPATSMIPAGSAGDSAASAMTSATVRAETIWEPAAGDDVHPGSTRYGHDLVAALGEDLGDVPAEPTGRPGNCDLHDVLLRGDIRFTGKTEQGPAR
jgi:carbohydrate-selective porin OprB